MELSEILQKIEEATHIYDFREREWLADCRTSEKPQVRAAIVKKAEELFRKKTRTFDGSLRFYELTNASGTPWRQSLATKAARKAIKQATDFEQVERLHNAIRHGALRLEAFERALVLATTADEYWALAVPTKKTSPEIWAAAVKACALKLTE